MRPIQYFIFLSFISLFSFSSCQTGPQCPAYNGLTYNDQYNPNLANKKYASNKDKVEAKKKAELNPKKMKKGRSSLFPKSFGVRSR